MIRVGMYVCVSLRGDTLRFREPTRSKNQLFFVASNHCVVLIWGGNACSWYLLIFDTLEPAGIEEPYNGDSIYIF
jgi:hypothetical protein